MQQSHLHVWITDQTRPVVRDFGPDVLIPVVCECGADGLYLGYPLAPDEHGRQLAAITKSPIRGAEGLVGLKRPWEK